MPYPYTTTRVWVGDCIHCHGAVYWHHDDERLVFTSNMDCLCELDKDKVPEWLKQELE
jgi:hypothetical protein